MDESITWPLPFNVIRRRSTNNTFGNVRKRADGTPRPHQGWDFEATLRTPAYAIADGAIEFIKDKGDYGLQLCMSFNLEGRQYWAFYAHLEKVFVCENNLIQRNQLICTTGESGNAQGMPAADQHLHLEIRTCKAPRRGLLDRVSPMVVFGYCPLTFGTTG
jgi:murein DD-endopeptidase MepM/ murein hydrolase activator NlpD